MSRFYLSGGDITDGGFFLGDKNAVIDVLNKLGNENAELKKNYISEKTYSKKLIKKIKRLDQKVVFMRQAMILMAETIFEGCKMKQDKMYSGANAVIKEYGNFAKLKVKLKGKELT